METSMLKRIMLALLGAALLAAPLRAATLELLNVSYDPTRELWRDVTAAFVPKYEKDPGPTLAIKQSHGGSGTQARAVIDGLEAVDHRARLGAGAAVRLLDGERGAGVLLVLRDEGRGDVAPQLARRVVGHVEQLEGGGPERRGEEGCAEQSEHDALEHGGLHQPWMTSQDAVGPPAIAPGRSTNEMSGETRRLGRQTTGGSTKAVPEGSRRRRGARGVAERAAARVERAQVSFR